MALISSVCLWEHKQHRVSTISIISSLRNSLIYNSKNEPAVPQTISIKKLFHCYYNLQNNFIYLTLKHKKRNKILNVVTSEENLQSFKMTAELVGKVLFTRLWKEVWHGVNTDILDVFKNIYNFIVIVCTRDFGQ